MVVNNNRPTDSINLNKELDKNFYEELSTIKGSEKIVDSFKFIEDNINPEFQAHLIKYKEGLLSLCAAHVCVANHPEVQGTIAQCNEDFLQVCGTEGHKRNRRSKFRGVLVESTNNPYFGSQNG